MVSGGNPGYQNITEIWNGTSWTEVNQMLTGRAQFAASFGSSTAALDAGGITNPPNVYTTKTEKWDGTSWSETGDISSATRLGAGGGTSSAGLHAGGRSDAYPTGGQVSEVWEDPILATKTFTAS